MKNFVYIGLSKFMFDVVLKVVASVTRCVCKGGQVTCFASVLPDTVEKNVICQACLFCCSSLPKYIFDPNDQCSIKIM